MRAEETKLLTPHRGAYVRVMTRAEALDLIIILESLTATMARLAAEAVAQGANTGVMKEAYEQLEPFRNPNVDDMSFIDRRRHFYDALIAIGRNSQLATVMPTMRIQLLRLQVQPYLTSKNRQSSLDEYSAITRAVLAGDSKLAARAMRQHMKGMQRRIANLPDAALPELQRLAGCATQPGLGHQPCVLIHALNVGDPKKSRRSSMAEGASAQMVPGRRTPPRALCGAPPRRRDKYKIVCQYRMA